ncbi:MAG: ABC transporter permease [Silvanigrellaceae bacterium]
MWLRWMVLPARFVFVLLSVVTLIFFIQRMIPGTPADAVLGPDAALVQKMKWMHDNGLDLPLSDQYVAYLKRLLQGDLGTKIVDGKPIAPILRERLSATFKLAGSAFLFSLVFAFASGVLGAMRPGSRTDNLLALASLVLVSAPVFITGTLLLWIFSVNLNLFPLTGNGGVKALFLPSVTLGAALAATTGRMMRAMLLDVMSENYIRTARAKGVGFAGLYFKHALRNAVLPVLAILGLQLAGLLGGTVITEQVFTWPGLGSLMIEAVNQRDYNLVSACVIVLATIHVLVAWLVELLQRIVDPRTEIR